MVADLQPNTTFNFVRALRPECSHPKPISVRDEAQLHNRLKSTLDFLAEGQMKNQLASNLRYAFALACFVLLIAFTTTASAQEYQRPARTSILTPGAMPDRTNQVIAGAATVGVYAAWGQADGKDVRAGLKFDGLTLPVGITAEGIKAFDVNGNEVWLKYQISRLTGNSIKFNVELPADHPFTIPGGPWARGSQIVLPGTLSADCATNPVFTAKITSGPPPNGELESLWHEIGWLDLSAPFCGVDGDQTWHKGQYYPPFEPGGLQEMAGSRITVRYGELEIFESPGGEKWAVISAVRILFPERRYDMRLAAVMYSLGCGSCR